jgi:hypothetical protein
MRSVEARRHALPTLKKRRPGRAPGVTGCRAPKKKKHVTRQPHGVTPTNRGPHGLQHVKESAVRGQERLRTGGMR